MYGGHIVQYSYHYHQGLACYGNDIGSLIEGGHISVTFLGRGSRTLAHQTPHVSMGSDMLISSSTMCSIDSPAPSVEHTAKKASQRRCWIIIARSSNLHPEICKESGSIWKHNERIGDIPMRLSAEVDERGYPALFMRLRRTLSSDTTGYQDVQVPGLHITVGPPTRQ